MDIKDSLESIKSIYMSDNSLSMLLDFERVLDTTDLYAFANWLSGELVAGPEITKYFVECKFMWPLHKMPDPKGAARLLPYGVKVRYQKTTVEMPAEIKSPDDYRPGSHKGRLIPVKVWLVDILMPKKLIKNIRQGSKEISGEKIDLGELETAYEKDFQNQSLMQQSEEDQQEMQGA